MPLKTSTSSWFTAAALLLIPVASAAAEEGVVRISDADTRPGVVSMTAMSAEDRPPIQQTSYNTTPHHLQQVSGSMYQPACNTCGPVCYGQSYPGCDMGMCCDPCCPDVCCDNGCCTEGCCNTGCDSFGECHRQRMVKLFAEPIVDNPLKGRGQRHCWRAQQLNYLNRNQRLANHLFGWLVPSGCCCQGCPPIGKYCVNYADNPGYSHPQDGQAWGAQGYGVPVTVPLPPNVRHSYNYSWGTPSSRITPMGNYSGTVAQHQSLYHQSW